MAAYAERAPTLAEVTAARVELGTRVRETPVWRWQGREIEALLGAATEAWLKLELFQVSGTFKARGALLNLLALAPDALERGVTAVSAGNHALAVAHAARALGTSAKVVMPKTANAARVAGCRALGAEVVLVDDVHQAFAEVERIEREEGRTFVHPFDSPRTLLGTATLGLELAQQLPNLEAVIVPIGGGGLAAGVAAAVKQSLPACQVWGVEPEGAAVMQQSLAAGEPLRMPGLTTIADSLAAPYTTPGAFGVCRQYLDGVVTVSDEALRDAMRLLFREMKLAVEPAGAAATAALLGPLAQQLTGKRIGLIVCGTNLDTATYCRLVGE
jgi:threonine dehydratase